MSLIKLDPVGVVTIDGVPFPAAKGDLKAYGPDPDTVVFSIVGRTKYQGYIYTEFVDGSGNRFPSGQDVINYINANFPKASGVTAEQLDAKIQNKTQAEYDALSTQDKNNGTLYLIPKT